LLDNAARCANEPDRGNPSAKSSSVDDPHVASSCRAEPPFGAANGQEKGNDESG
jgi:hypothetical protein